MADYVTRSECIKTNKQIMDDVREIKKDVKELANSFNDFRLNLMDNLDERYADKRIEKNFDNLTIFVITTVLGAILFLVLK